MSLEILQRVLKSKKGLKFASAKHALTSRLRGTSLQWGLMQERFQNNMNLSLKDVLHGATMVS